ncbi:MAG: anion transporter [Acidobacteriota bacterium]
MFAFTFTVMALGSWPGLRLDRTGAAVVGAGAMVASGVLSLEEAWRAIHYETILLLFGMMIVVANLRLAGFFPAVAQWFVRRAHAPATLLAVVVAVTGVLSALFVNDTICLVMTPLVLAITRTLERRPLPYLLAVAMASNAGSAATITGNPQNMMIGGFSGIPYGVFAAALAPVALFGMAVTYGVLRWVHREEFAGGGHVEIPATAAPVDRWLLGKSLVAAVAMFAAFFAGAPVAGAAMVAGAALLLTRRVRPAAVYAEIDWPLLVLFAGLFAVLAGVEKTGFDEALFAGASRLGLARLPVLSFASLLLSNLISNVPAVLLCKPFIERLPQAQEAWLVLSMSATLAGNLTLAGSLANLIVAERARETHRIGFGEYARVGVPVSVLTVAGGAVWLLWLRP